MQTFAQALEQAMTQKHSIFSASTRGPLLSSTLPALQPVHASSNTSGHPSRNGEDDQGYEQLCQQMKRRQPYPQYPTLVIRTHASQVGKVTHLLEEDDWIQRPEDKDRARFATVTYVKEYSVNGLALPAAVFKKTSAGTILSVGTTYVVWIDIKYPVFVTFEEDNQALLVDL